MKAFPIIVCVLAVFLLAGMPSFLALITGNISSEVNVAEVSLSPGAAFFIGLGGLGMWFVAVPVKDKKLWVKRVVVGFNMVWISQCGLLVLLYLAQC